MTRIYYEFYDWAAQWVLTMLSCLITSSNEILSHFCKGIEITFSKVRSSSVSIYTFLIFKPVMGITALNALQRFAISFYLLTQPGLAFAVMIWRPPALLKKLLNEALAFVCLEGCTLWCFNYHCILLSF